MHIFWDCDAGRVKVANDTPDPIDGLTADLSIYDLEGHLLRHEQAGIALPATSAVEVLSLRPRPAGAGTVFIKLRLQRGENLLDDNFYWSNGPGAPCRDLDSLPKVALVTDARILSSAVGAETTRLRSRPRGADAPTAEFGMIVADGDTTRITVTMTNPTASVALMTRLTVLRGTSGGRVLPVFYEDNYLNLLPGEKRSVSLTFATADLAGEPPRLSVEGWNIVPADVQLH